MKQTKLFFVMMLMLVMSNAFTSCQKDVVVLQEIQEQETLDNPALVTKLKALGFTFDGDALVIDDKVQNTTSLDLSGAKLTSAEGLEVFPKLEKVNLSNNSLTNTFDFAGLPETVKSVNLAGNDLFQFKGLATVTDDGFTLQRKLTELTLPASARFNVDLLPSYYKETQGKTTLKMQNPTNNQIESYTTLRNIPDETLRNYIKATFPSIMKGEQVDLSKPVTEAQPFIIDMIHYNPYYGGPVDITKIKNMEGIEYIINAPSYKGATVAIIAKKENRQYIAYLYPGKNVSGFGLTNINTGYINWSKMKNLRLVNFESNDGVKEIDLSSSEVFMKNEKVAYLDAYGSNKLIVYNCPNLEDIKLPTTDEPTMIREIKLLKLPKLKTFDMSKFEGLYALYLAELPDTDLTMPNIKYYITDAGVDVSTDMNLKFCITADMISNPKIDAFIKKYQGHLNDWNQMQIAYPELTPYNYTK